MQFTKMHGLGNDYVIFDGFREPLPDDLPELARRVSDRHFGIGGDGLITFEPSPEADARMRIFNVDGSEAEMCGNGLRCVAKALYERGHCRSASQSILTGRGRLDVECFVRDELVESVRVDMGRPDFEPEARNLEIDDRELELHVVSMGNPHAILFVEEPTDEWVLGIGPRIERHPSFPHRTNVEFVRIDTRDAMTVRVWERGCGETLACGTGACATVVAATLAGHIDGCATVRLPGGDLQIDWTAGEGVLMTGPATEVFSGKWSMESATARVA